MPRYNLAFRDVVRRDQVNSIFNTDFDGASQYEESGEFRASKEYKELTGAFANDVSEENEDDLLTNIYVAFWKKYSQEFTKNLEEDTGAGDSNKENIDTDQTTPKKSKRERRVITMPLLTAMLAAKNNGDDDTLAVMMQKLNTRDRD